MTSNTTQGGTPAMKKSFVRIFGLTVVALAAAQAMAADLKIGFISSLSGPVAALGVPYEKEFAQPLPNIRKSAGARSS
jgi:ABC-type branched-subunit amino acid transport system substrate-binding protein